MLSGGTAATLLQDRTGGGTHVQGGDHVSRESSERGVRPTIRALPPAGQSCRNSIFHLNLMVFLSVIATMTGV